MSSSSANREAASDDQWMYLQGSGSAVLPFENHETCSGNSSLGNFNHHVINSSLTKATIQNIVNYHTDCGSCTIPLEVSDDPCSAIPESSTLLQVSDHVFSGELDPRILVEEECFPELAMCRNSTEEFAELFDKTISELDPVLLLFEQENPGVLPRSEINEDGGFMDDGRNAMINCQKETSLSCPLESSDKLEPIMQDSRKPDTFPEQENQLSVSSSKSGKRVRKGEMNQYRFKLQMEKMESQPHMEGGSTSKKQQHNAKEKVRRMNLNASYLALASLLPNSQRSKKWSAPGIIDEVLEYIPELESEIEELTLMKNTELSKIEGRQPNQQDLSAERQAPTISIHEVGQGEVIVQICSQRRDKEDAALSNLFQNLEEQSISIASASSINVCKESTVCHHLHIKVCHSLPRTSTLLACVLDNL
ncbi:ACHAETE-SCUTE TRANSCRIPTION FACTOR-RELATED [Salix purpurea]|uniref:ACHAETE-SCUTE TRANSCRIPTION FACTOR-RELATED n=2 Tax=Salix purpurea TaxID=77065 RepID=A0A9Q0TAK0_SALPP|nr:ACHAETE-SCUTE TRANSCRIPTION FACTOR-RELATED [Salix purpurea]